MNTITRTTRACTVETLSGALQTAIQAHAAEYGLEDIGSDVLMCCETVSVNQKTGLLSGVGTTVSAVYITPKWLVWADGEAGAGSARLKHIDVRDYRETASYAVSPDHGLNITGRYTDRNRTGLTFIGLGSDADGQKFRLALEEAIGKLGR